MTKKVDERLAELDDVYSSGVASHREGERQVQFVGGDELRRRLSDLNRRKATEAGRRPVSMSLARFSRG